MMDAKLRALMNLYDDYLSAGSDGEVALIWLAEIARAHAQAGKPESPGAEASPETTGTTRPKRRYLH